MNNLAQINMIKQQLRTGNVLDEYILELFESLPRDEFVPEQYRAVAYSDMQIPLAHEQRMMTPLEEGLILQNLQLTGDEKVLEIGTGSGYLTALLAKSCAHVTSIDIHADFCESAQKKLADFKIDNVDIINGDGRQGWMEKAPYNVVVLTGCIDEITKGFRLQLMKGGKLFAILGDSIAMHGVYCQLTESDEWKKQIVFETSLPLLVDKAKHPQFIF